jgi:hypothetical protein
LEESYARAANALGAAGDQSGLVQTPYGLHVILLTERLQEKRYSNAELFELLAVDVYAARASKMLNDLLERISKKTPIETSRAVAELTGQVQVSK